MGINEKRLEFLDEMVEYYSANPKERRCKIKDSCRYSPETLNLPNSEGCAIGRKLPREIANYLDKKYNDNVDIETLFGLELDIIPDEIIELGPKFLYKIQCLHDNDCNWDDNGITEIGVKCVEGLKKCYGLYE